MRTVLKVFLVILALGVLFGAGGAVSIVCGILAAMVLLEETCEILRDILAALTPQSPREDERR